MARLSLLAALVVLAAALAAGASPAAASGGCLASMRGGMPQVGRVGHFAVWVERPACVSRRLLARALAAARGHHRFRVGPLSCRASGSPRVVRGLGPGLSPGWRIRCGGFAFVAWELRS